MIHAVQLDRYARQIRLAVLMVVFFVDADGFKWLVQSCLLP